MEPNTYIKEKHGHPFNFIANIVLVGVLGAVLIRIAAIAVYSTLPSTYFLQYDALVVPDVVYACREDSVQRIHAEAVREIYPFLPDSVKQTRWVEARVVDEIFRLGGVDRKIDDQSFTPIYEWREDNRANIELQYDTILLPGRYQIRSEVIPIVPYIGEKKAIPVESNVFEVRPCEEKTLTTPILTPILKQ